MTQDNQKSIKKIMWEFSRKVKYKISTPRLSVLFLLCIIWRWCGFLIIWILSRDKSHFPDNCSLPPQRTSNNFHEYLFLILIPLSYHTSLKLYGTKMEFRIYYPVKYSNFPFFINYITGYIFWSWKSSVSLYICWWKPLRIMYK